MADEVTGYQTVDPSSYHAVDQTPIHIFEFFKSIPAGLSGSAGLIFFILTVGGALQVIQATGTIDIGLKNLIKRFAGRENLLLIVILLAFGTLSCFAAVSEEFLAFMPLIYMVCLGLGFDSMVAAFLVLGSSSIGYCGGMTNAYTVGVAQTIAELPMFSGIGFRTIVFIIFEVVSIIWICRYATKIRKNPEKSLMFDIDKQYRTELDLSNIPPMTTRHKMVLVVFILGIAAMVYGTLKMGFYLSEMGAVFIIMTILAGVVGGLDANTICTEFVEGTKGLLWVGLVMGLCKALTNILTDANIIDTIIHAIASLLVGLPKTAAACAIFAVQDIINFVIPSGSGQAAVTMPLMVPLGDLLGVYLAQTQLRSLFQTVGNYWVCAVRLLLIPALTVAVLSLLPWEMLEVKQTLLIAACTPIGANVAVYAQKLNKNYAYAVQLVCLSTLLSAASMPIVLGAATWLWA